MDGSDTPGRRPTLWVTTHQSPPPTHRVAENPTLRLVRYEWMTASDRADDGTPRLPTVRPFFLYRGLLATSHRSVHPPAPVRGKIHASHDRPRDRADARCGRGGRARGDRPTDRPVRCPRWRARRMTTRRRVDIERRAARRGRAREHAMKKTSAPDRGTTVAVVRAEGSDVDGKTTGLVRPRRMRCDDRAR